MDVKDRIIEQQALMMEAYKDFRDLMDELKDERGLGANAFSEYQQLELPADYELSEDDEEEASEMSADLPSLMSLYSHECNEFPMQESFSREQIDPEDPAFWSGKSIGIPVAVVVRQHDGQDKLLPIKNGMFTEL